MGDYKDGTILDAVNRRDMAKLDELLNGDKAGLNDTNSIGETALLQTVQRNDIAMAKKLIDAGANVNIQDSIQDSPYLLACAKGCTEILEHMLKNAKPEPDQKIYNRYGGNGLIPAAEKGHIDNVRLLLEDGRVDINHQNKFGYTALIEAVALTDNSKLYQDIVKLIVDAGADKTLVDEDGNTAMDYAEKMDSKEMIALLS